MQQMKRPIQNPNAAGIPLDDPVERRKVRRLIISLDHLETPPGVTTGVPLCY